MRVLIRRGAATLGLAAVAAAAGLALTGPTATPSHTSKAPNVAYDMSGPIKAPNVAYDM